MSHPSLHVAAIAALLHRAGAWAFAQGIDQAAREWAQAGFDAQPSDVVEAWLAARCWRPSAALAMHRAGMSPVDAARRVTRETGYDLTLGHLVSAGELTAGEALVLACTGKARL